MSSGSIRALPRSNGGLRKRLTQHLIDRIDQNQVHLAAQIGRDVFEVGLVPRGQQHATDAGAVRTEHLLLDPADGEDAPAQRDLACHRDVVARRTPGED
jgi:hypothetical protein